MRSLFCSAAFSHLWSWQLIRKDCSQVPNVKSCWISSLDLSRLDSKSESPSVRFACDLSINVFSWCNVLGFDQSKKGVMCTVQLRFYCWILTHKLLKCHKYSINYQLVDYSNEMPSNSDECVSSVLVCWGSKIQEFKVFFATMKLLLIVKYQSGSLLSEWILQLMLLLWFAAHHISTISYITVD